MEKMTVQARLNGKDYETVELGELTWADDLDCIESCKVEKFNNKTFQKDVSYDGQKLRDLRLCKCITSHELKPGDFAKMPRKDVMQLLKAYSELNDLSDADKSEPSGEDT